MVSMRDVARAAEVSIKTVSRVHTGDPHVSPETRERVEGVIRDLGYVPNGLATMFREGKSPVIGIVVPDISDPYFAALVQGLDAVAADNDLITVVASIAGEKQERERVEALLSRRLQGLVIAPTSHDQAYLSPWFTQLPIVFVDRQPEHLTADWIESDDQPGAHAAVNHLIGLGHQSIAFISEDLEVSTVRARLSGYREALNDAGIAHRPELEVLVESDRHAVAAVIDALLAFPHPPTALFAANARSAMALVPLLRSNRFAVVSFGDFPLADAVQPTISALTQNPRRVGELAAQRLLDRIAQPDADLPRRVEVKTTLIERESSSRAPSNAG
jgi:LacI family transcriptional regulator